MATFAVLVGALAASSSNSAGTTTPTAPSAPLADPAATIPRPDAATTDDGFGPGTGQPFERRGDRGDPGGDELPSNTEPWGATPSAPGTGTDTGTTDQGTVSGDGTATAPATPTTSSHGS